MVNRGFLSTYEDGSFQGNNPVDRYTLATTVARILDEIEAGRIIGSQSDADLLRELTIEFRAELVQFYADKQRMETLLTDTQKQVVATEERLNNVVAGQVQLSDEVAKLKADLMQEANKTTESLNQFQTLIQEQRASLQALKEQVHAQQSSIESHQSQLAAHGGQVTTQEDRLIELQNAIVKIDQNLLQQQTDIDRIWNWIAEKELVFSMLVLDQEFQDSIKELSDAIAGLDQEHQLIWNNCKQKLTALPIQLPRLTER